MVFMRILNFDTYQKFDSTRVIIVQTDRHFFCNRKRKCVVLLKFWFLGRRCNLEIWFEVGGGGGELELQFGGREG